MSLARLSHAARGRKPEGVLVYRGATALRPGIRALPLTEALDLVG